MTVYHKLTDRGSVCEMLKVLPESSCIFDHLHLLL